MLSCLHSKTTIDSNSLLIMQLYGLSKKVDNCMLNYAIFLQNIDNRSAISWFFLFMGRLAVRFKKS